ncbi:hypothetical protein Tco_1289291, partial [Tanacetum coccineum]
RTLRGRSLCFVLEMLNKVTPPDTYSVQAPSGGVTYTLSSMDWNALQDLFCSFSPLKIDFCGLGLESVSIRRIQCIGYGVLGFLGVGTTHEYAVSSLMDTAYWLSE